MSDYDVVVGREILPELRAAGLLARLLYEHPAIGRSLFSRLGQSLVDGIADVFAGARGYAAIPRRVLARWTRRLLPDRP